jgi:F-type H+-transporting ATPase subunit gamma
MRSIENIHEITRAMEMIAAFRFKKAENRFSRSKTYFSETEKLVRNLAASRESLAHPLFEKRPVRKKTLVVFTGDKGLCGSYNANLLKAASAWLGDNRAFEPSLVPVGKVGLDSFKKRGVSILFSHPEKSAVTFESASAMAGDLQKTYFDRRTDSVELLYASYRLGTAGVVSLVPYLGLGYVLDRAKSPHSFEPIFEPDFEGVFSPLLSKFLQIRIYGVFLESLASEYSARMIAMKQATENGEEVLDSLRLLRNKTRQATITRELSEIVGGASVLV